VVKTAFLMCCKDFFDVSDGKAKNVDREFGKSILTSLALHALVLLLLFKVLDAFLVSHSPALMELNLIGVSSLGDGSGSQSTLRGTESVPVPAADKGEGQDFASPKAASVPQPKVPQAKGELSSKKIKPSPRPQSKAERSAYLESLRREAPIGIAPNSKNDDHIKTTAGLGYLGVTGTPNGNVNIEGELAGRNIRRKVVPAYPDWAKKQGVEGTIQYRITVLPNGYLKDDVQLEQTSGWRELDRVVYEALLQWEFDALPEGSPQVNQSGLVTFAFGFKNQP
jgi:protein TonB